MGTHLARLAVVAAAAVVAPCLLASRDDARARESGAPKVTEVAPGVFFAETATAPEFLGSNSGWIVCGDHVLVVDASFPITARTLADEVKRTSKLPIRLVFDTHWHPDHSFGN